MEKEGSGDARNGIPRAGKDTCMRQFNKGKKGRMLDRDKPLVREEGKNTLENNDILRGLGGENAGGHDGSRDVKVRSRRRKKFEGIGKPEE